MQLDDIGHPVDEHAAIRADPDLYAIYQIPNSIDYKLITLIILAAILSSLIGTYIPARRAAKLRAVEVLRV